MSEPLASASFEVGLETLVEAEWRVLAGAGGRLRHALLQLAIGLAAGAAVAGVLLLMGDSRPAHPVGGGIGVAVGLALGRTVGAPARARRALAARLRSQLGQGPFCCTVALHPGHVAVHTPNGERRIPWATVDAVYEQGDDCVIHAPPARVVVPARAFADATARAHFLAAARSLRHHDPASRPGR